MVGMSDTPRFQDGYGREYVLRRRPKEGIETYRRRCDDQARLRIRHPDLSVAFQQVVFVEADRARLAAAVADLRQRLSDAEYELYRASTYLDGDPDLERQYEIAFSYDCQGPFRRLMRAANLAEKDIVAVETNVSVPEAVRPAYADLYRRGISIINLAQQIAPRPPEVHVAIEEVEVLVSSMAKGNL